MKAFRYFLISTLLLCFLFIVTVPIWKPYLFVNENLLPETTSGLKKMHLIKGGGFKMGDETGKNSNALPVHYVKVSSFYMDEMPVTVGDFQKYISAGGSLPSYWNNEHFQQKNMPITGVSWNMAVDFCNWRSKVEGLEPAYEESDKRDDWGNKIWELNESNNGYRLPTEAEFEFAARGGLTNKAYPWGEDFEKTYANYDNERGKPLGNWVLLAEAHTQKSNNYGLKGMSGNIWHWCNDWFDYSYNEKESGKNPIGSRKIGTKVLRGGSWGSIDPEQLKVFYRSKASIGSYNYDIGFRCVRPIKRGILSTLKSKSLNLEVAHDFYNFPVGKEEIKEIAYDSDDFRKRLAKYLEDNYSNSLYFHEKINHQQKLNAGQLADIIINTSLKRGLNPVFITSLMVAETGMGTVSMARWSNNPIAHNWEMPELNSGYVVFASNNFNTNHTYYNLKACFNDFYNYLNQSYIKSAATSDLFDFHQSLNGEEKYYLIQNISNVYRELTGMRIEEDFPRNNVGKLIYTKWISVPVLDEQEEEVDQEESIDQEEKPIEQQEQQFIASNNTDTQQENTDLTDDSEGWSAQNEQPIESEPITQVSKKPAPAADKEIDVSAAPLKRVYYLTVKQDLDEVTAELLAKQLKGKGFPETMVIPHNNKSAIAVRQFKSKKDAKSAEESLSELFSDIKIIQQ